MNFFQRWCAVQYWYGSSKEPRIHHGVSPEVRLQETSDRGHQQPRTRGGPHALLLRLLPCRVSLYLFQIQATSCSMQVFAKKLQLWILKMCFTEPQKYLYITDISWRFSDNLSWYTNRTYRQFNTYLLILPSQLQFPSLKLHRSSIDLP